MNKITQQKLEIDILKSSIVLVFAISIYFVLATPEEPKSWSHGRMSTDTNMIYMKNVAVTNFRSPYVQYFIAGI